jgi:apolipoprotein N-acyltransferase
MVVYPFTVLSTLLRPWMLAIIGGVLTTLTIPPFRFSPLAIPGIALLYLAVERTSRMRSRFGVTLLWAAALYTPSLWWTTAFSVPGGVLAALIEATITALTVMLIVNRTKNRNAVGPATISALMFADSLRSLWPWGGTPLGGIDLGQANSRFASIVGNFGRLGLIGATAAQAILFVVWLRGGKHSGLAFWATILVPALLGLPYATFHYNDGVRHSPRLVTVIQGGGPRGLFASPDNARNTYLAHLEATKGRPLNDGRPALILWPENTVDTVEFAKSKEFEELRKLTGTYLSVGITEDGGSGQFINAQVMISPDGKVIDRYEKVRRVPYGEFFPFRDLIERLGFATFPDGEARPGSGTGILRTPDITYGVLISYEGFFDDRARDAVNAGALVLLIPTNASSYKTTHLPSQQIAAAQLRALETHRDVIQAGPTGYSALINADGKVVSKTELGKRAVFDAQFTPRTDKTLYVRFNDAPALIIAALLAIGSILINRRKRTPRSADQSVQS